MSSEIIKQATWDDRNAPDWMSKINWQEYEKLAFIGYTPEKLAMFYNINKHEFMYYFMQIESVLKYHYDRGVLFYQAKDGIDMVTDAADNATQAQRLDKLRRQVEFEKMKNEVIYGGF
jgi:hypothetical protein